VTAWGLADLGTGRWGGTYYAIIIIIIIIIHEFHRDASLETKLQG